MNFPLAPEAASAPRNGGRVLVVDDEPHVLAVASTILQSQGFDVSSCESGEAALAILNESTRAGLSPHVMVLDLTLPGGMSGFEVLERVQEMSPDMPVIACSGYFQEDARELCQAIGFIDILQKPYSLEQLCAIVRRCITPERTSSSPAS
ncbi:MAG: Transcriptional regulatory protein CreB [Prosthecobacter sp.]|nr:Transcriptional regulatory protein CreB [Prosthecobacter sp.]